MKRLDALRAWARELKTRLLALWFCRSHPDTPRLARVLAIIVVAYAFSPIDLIPDFIPVLGFLDDVILLPLGIWLVIRLLPPHVLADGRRQAETWLAAQRGKPHSRAGAVAVVLVWLALAGGFALFAWHRMR